MRTKSTPKEPIRLRVKKLTDGSKSLFLAAYHNGRYEYEFLRMYLIPEIDARAKERNADTLRIATEIKNQRIKQYYNSLAGIESYGEDILLTSWIIKATENKSDNTKDSYRKLLLHIKNFTNGKPITLRQVNRQFCEDFIKYMRRQNDPRSLTPKTIKENTVWLYYTKFAALMNKAVKSGYISNNPFQRIDDDIKPSKNKVRRGFLTIEEVRALMAAPCRHESVKRAFLFSCFCGLRISDVRKLRYEDIQQSQGGHFVQIVQQKTKEPLFVPLSKSAMQYVGNGKKGIIFDLPIASHLNYTIDKWAERAGITKKISYHISRHTFAVSMVTAGADIYTISKLMGHTNVTTTQIYADLLDSKKAEAVSLLDNLI